MLSLIKSVLKSIELYLSLKNKLFYIELRYSHEKTRKTIIQEMRFGILTIDLGVWKGNFIFLVGNKSF